MLLLLWMEMGVGLKRRMPRIKGHYEGMQTIKRKSQEKLVISVSNILPYTLSPLKIGLDLKVK